MKVDSNLPVHRITPRQRARSGSGASSGAGFASLLGGAEETSGAVGGPTETAPVAALDALLAAQDVMDPREQRRAWIRRGHELLNLLERIREGLLLGEVPPDRLRSLHHAVARLQDERAGVYLDAELAEILAWIEVRAAVELAKYGVDTP